jgi:endonuclease YncB( thermonuclease family)
MTSLIRRIIPQILLLFSIATFSLGVWANDITGIVVSVADGDSITVLSAEKKQYKIRMAAIDSPEKAQAFGQRSKQHLSDLVYKKEVRVQIVDIDRYKRHVGVVFLGDQNINQTQVEAGFAWVYRQYVKNIPKPMAKTFIVAEASAKTNKAGLWADKDPVPPWAWRRAQRKN